MISKKKAAILGAVALVALLLGLAARAKWNAAHVVPTAAPAVPAVTAPSSPPAPAPTPVPEPSPAIVPPVAPPAK
jgi:hypothetical protein